MVHHLSDREDGHRPGGRLTVDTIAAIATPSGRGGIGVVRVSGPLAAAVGAGVLGAPPSPRQAVYRAFRGAEGEALDRGVAIFYAAPRSFTGEDVLELHGHGGPVVLDMLLERVLALGARRARPGEFTLRAFLNDKIDLARAEAVADLIDSATRQSARAAARSLEGVFSQRVLALDRAVLELRVFCEGAIDFADEDIDHLSESDVQARLADVAARVDALLREARQGAVLKDGVKAVLIGAPNVGKSSLFNRLAGEDRAIVTDLPGTTRDALSVDLDLDGLLVRLVDTAGLREAADAIEAEGVARAERAAASADIVLRVVDDRHGPPPGAGAAGEVLVRNKSDLSGAEAGTVAPGTVRVSAVTGAGIAALVAALKAAAGYNVGEGAFTARRRHVEALGEAAAALRRAAACLATAEGELLAEELRDAQAALGAIVGATTTDRLLGEIFATFCIGK